MAVWAWTIRKAGSDGLFWHREKGWTTRAACSVFTIPDQRTYPLPEGGSGTSGAWELHT